MVDVDHFSRLVRVSERNRPVRPNRLVEVQRALVVAVMQSRWADERVEPTIVDAVNDRLDDHADVVDGGFAEERKSARSLMSRRQGSDNFVRARRIEAEQRRILTFNRIEYGHFAVSLFFVIRVFDHLAVVRTDRNERRCDPEAGEREHVGHGPVQHRASGRAEGQKGHRYEQRNPFHLRHLRLIAGKEGSPHDRRVSTKSDSFRKGNDFLGLGIEPATARTCENIPVLPKTTDRIDYARCRVEPAFEAVNWWVITVSAINCALATATFIKSPTHQPSAIACLNR